ncbi:flagellar M-ring protein FliF [Ramlibacter sp. USB13]|uniref:Flagellar M-ring protein FliF n=1 Tax=Ramlibacter cellulosilyticus TaxID=2764187 RepID=A0A923SD94_9BURK|nr:flagellar basal-body MS-ring/collar protein FliF [Ramlibacter cellulosilyticus]MBC5785098.1 flagellar M-ring protein FliF [Ramlibacter cellulosilyticus]
MHTWWPALPPRSRALVAGALALFLVLLAASGWWALRSDPAVLFTDLRPQDAAAFGTELEKLKVPYTVADGGTTLLVDRSQVHAVRLKLMGRELPLHGTVGLELFNSTDFGMTEFAQKVNFQRALQGELTRTILSFAEIRDARVHLVLPEQGLFRQNVARAKAAVTLAVRGGHALRAEQVSGIQRLVAAAVPGLAPHEVTIVDTQGVPLSRPPEGDGDAGSAGTRLDLKRETESYLARKAGAVLDQALGPGQALASVDVSLNMDQVRVTTEDVLPAGDGKGAGATGVLVRERESARDNAGADPRGTEARSLRGSSMQRDVEYQAGRRVEQVVSQPGAIRRLHVVAVVRDKLEPQTQEHLQRVLAAAVGALPERGDVVVVQGMRAAPAVEVPQVVPTPAAPALPRSTPGDPGWPLAGVLLVVLGVIAVLLLRRAARMARVQPLTEPQRRAALQRLQVWMHEAEPAAAAMARPPGEVQ